MNRAILVCAAFLFSLASPNAFADTTVEKYMHESDETTQSLNKLYLQGVMAGLESYNTFLRTGGRQPEFCEPMKIAITADQAADIMIRWAKTQPPKINDIPISVALLLALKDAFACPSPDNK